MNDTILFFKEEEGEEGLLKKNRDNNRIKEKPD